MTNTDKAIMLSRAYMYAHAWNGLYFKLTQAVVIRIKNEKRFSADCFGLWENITDDEGREYHRITLDFSRHFENDQELRNSVFHELVHAYQHEVKEEVDHNASFWEWEEMAQNERATIRFFGDNFEDFKK